MHYPMNFKLIIKYIIVFPFITMSCALPYKQGMSKTELENDIGIIVSSKIETSISMTFVRNESGKLVVNEYALLSNKKVLNRVVERGVSSYISSPPIELCLSTNSFSDALKRDDTLLRLLTQIHPDFLKLTNYERKVAIDRYICIHSQSGTTSVDISL